MSQLTDQELRLMTAVVKNLNVNIVTNVDWDQVVVAASYKDSKNAKTMWYRLVKKLEGLPATATTAAAAASTHGDDDNAGEGRSDAPAKVTKKRKAAATKGNSSSVKVGRPTKKPKTTGAHFNPVNKDSASNGDTKSQSSDAETLVEQKSEGDSN